jgi:nucleotide-binding universal stress UspA family protein
MFERIVVGAAQSETARTAVEQAAELASLADGELHLVLAFDPYWDRIEPEELRATKEAKAYLASLVESLGTPIAKPVHTHPRPGDAAEAILTLAREIDADLIVVGSRGMHGAGRVLGSVPNSVAHHAECSVLVTYTG